MVYKAWTKLLAAPLLVLFLLCMLNFSSRNTAPVTIRLDAIGGLRYDQLRFKVRPGEAVRIVLTNQDEMAHNVVFVSPGARHDVVADANKLGVRGESLGYIPDANYVLASIGVVPPGGRDSVTFTAPLEEGVYPYVCTYPGHGTVMYGAMYVTGGDMPELAEDPHIPQFGAPGTGGSHGVNHPAAEAVSGHPYDIEPPYLYRTYLPGSGPASIAVYLAEGLSYCWDAGQCRLRYAWSGGFLDNTELWKGHFDANSEVLGETFYRDRTRFPLHMDNPGNIPTVGFKGYRLVDGYPEFHYTLNGADVFELITPGEKGMGLVRTIKIPGCDRRVWFMTHPADGVRYRSSKGQWVSGNLCLSPEEGGLFTIIMTKE